ncbi:unnamed protein product [Haemonchus placei]|uniref:CPL domain-containing protein n=1 Tax=Haemonchus placei TaxID=6290 RepID=A0A0N4WX92_HAEPC|nr:unnamed protein product [Haemonchus placei]
MSKLRLTEDENVDETINIDPTSPSPLPEKAKDKRVSFSGNMERVKVFDKNVKDLKIKPSSASPGKGILRAIPKKVSPKKKKKKPEVISTYLYFSFIFQCALELFELLPDRCVDGQFEVTKKVKEQLLTMDRKQRKAFLRELKKNPNHDRAMECKLLWEKIRSKKTPKQERDEHVSKLFGLVKGFASKLIYTHDISRGKAEFIHSVSLEIYVEVNPRSLEEIIAEEPTKKKLILQHLEETTVRLSLCHRLLRDFASHCDPEQLTNLIDSLKDRIPEIVHTPDGSYVAMKCIWNANVKDRKLIVKNFKDLVVKVAMEHYGHRVLLALFDTIDDTVLVNKCITTVNLAGSREGDSNPYSKKEKKDRYAEIYRNICESLYAYLASNMESLIFDHNRSKFVAACLETTSSYDLFDRQVPAEMRQKCNEALAQIAKQEFVPMDNERLHLIEHLAGNFVLMAVLRCDNGLPEDQRLSVAIVNTLSKEELGSWICCNKGCHVLLKMLHCGSTAVKEKVKEAVNMKQLREYTFRGATLLVDALSK